MQFSKKVSQLSRLHNIDPKDVLFAFLISAGASTAESFAVIFRPASTTNNALSSKASQYIGQRPGLRKLIDELTTDPETGSTSQRRGRPRKEAPEEVEEDKPALDYTDKDAVLKWLAIKAERAEKESTQIAAINAISNLQRMKQEAAVEDEKRVIFYVPLSFDRCTELLEYLHRYYAENPDNHNS